MNYADLIRQLDEDDARIERDLRFQQGLQDILDVREREHKAELERQDSRLLRWVNKFGPGAPL